jgi:SAM-dependent methyltransferase
MDNKNGMSELKQLQWTPELVGRFWDAVARSPLAELNFARTSGAKLLAFVSDYIKPEKRCLDFGAGDGDLMRLLVERGCRVAGYEPAEERRKKILAQDFARSPNFLGLVDDTCKDVFDVLIAADVIEHILDADLPRVLNRWRQFLSPGGILIVTTPNNEDLAANSTYCPVSGLWFHRMQHVRSFTGETLNALFAPLGFTRLHDHHVDFSSNAELMRQLRVVTRENRLRRRYGHLYPLIPNRRRKREGKKKRDLRVGNESHLIYVGRLSG